MGFIFGCAKLAKLEKKEIILLGIESSCDDTSAAVLKNKTVLSNCVAGQRVHQAYGGVVPELASRAHQQNIIPVVDAAIRQAGIDKKAIDGVAFTRGPGLLGALLVGVSFAKSFALGLRIPLIEVHHLQAHVWAHFIDTVGRRPPRFPFVCLTVSGGHTQIVVVRDFSRMEVIGQTLDDAAGEAFDKAAKLLGLPYPGGPLIDRYAKEGDPQAFAFPHPQVGGYDYSFSGLKTALRYFLKRHLQQDAQFIQKNLASICASYQQTIIQVVLKKLIQACRDYRITEVAIAGGVAANSQLRSALHQTGQREGWNTYVPPLEYCTDNAGMVAIAGHYKYLKGDFSGQDVTANARLKFAPI